MRALGTHFFFLWERLEMKLTRYILHSVDVARYACSQDSQGLWVSAVERAASCNTTACSEPCDIS